MVNDGQVVGLVDNTAVTLAQLNAGLTLIACPAGRKIVVHDYKIRAIGGALAACTDVRLQDNNGTPVVVTTIAVAALTEGAVNFPSVANNTLGAGFAPGSCTAAKDLVIVKTGSAATTATHLYVTVCYSLIPA